VLVGGLLRELGYDLATTEPTARERLQARAMRKVYLPYFASKHFLKAHTPLGMLLTRTNAWAEQPRAGGQTQAAPAAKPAVASAPQQPLNRADRASD
jgi:hypothetical protein